MIIVSYNVKHFLEQCLYAVRKATTTIEADVFVGDNASSDGSVEYLQLLFPTIYFIPNKHNSRFAKANNQALEIATGKYILFLNPDTILAEDSLTACIRFMETHPHAGACGVRMIDGSGRFLPESKRGFPSPKTSFYKLAGLTAALPQSRQFARYYLGHLPENQNSEVDVLAGAFFFARHEVLQKTGGFDEAFFMYGEDIDLSYRIRQAGYQNYYLAQTSIIHFKGESTPKRSPQAIRNFYGAMGIFVKKYHKGMAASLFSFFIQRLIWLKLLGSTSNPKASPDKATAPLHTLIAGDMQGLEKAQSILRQHKSPFRKISKAPTGIDLPAIINKQPVDEIIFCEGDSLPFKQIIQWMQTLPPAISFKIYAAGSGSIVGSGRKDMQGNVLS